MEPFERAVRHVSVNTMAEDSVQGRGRSGPIAAGDLSLLFGRQRTTMVQLARMLTGSNAVAEEVVQDAFVKLQQLRQAPDNPDGYLRTVVANLSKSHLRRLRLERRLPATQRTVFADPEIDETWEVLCRLPFRQRAVLALRFYNDLSEADIARVLGCRPGTVKSSLHRGLARLREELS
jgi:RNA polymerase sigma factor (sigma-70 family)